MGEQTKMPLYVDKGILNLINASSLEEGQKLGQVSFDKAYDDVRATVEYAKWRHGNPKYIMLSYDVLSKTSAAVNFCDSAVVAASSDTYQDIEERSLCGGEVWDVTMEDGTQGRIGIAESDKDILLHHAALSKTLGGMLFYSIHEQLCDSAPGEAGQIQISKTRITNAVIVVRLYVVCHNSKRRNFNWLYAQYYDLELMFDDKGTCYIREVKSGNIKSIDVRDIYDYIDETTSKVSNVAGLIQYYRKQ